MNWLTGSNSLQRLFKDFPWLWALRQAWKHAGTNNIKVTEADTSFEGLLCLVSDASIEMWVHTFSPERRYEAIQKIQPLPGTRWVLCTGFPDVTHVVVEFKSISSPAPIVIYRPHKNETFEQMAERLKATAV